MGIPKKHARQWRLVHALVTLFFGGLAIWLFTTGGDRMLASLLALAALFAGVDAILGWHRNPD